MKLIEAPKTVSGLKLYHCPEWHAFVTPEHCRRIHEMMAGARAHEEPPSALDSLGFCVSCPGGDVL